MNKSAIDLDGIASRSRKIVETLSDNFPPRSGLNLSSLLGAAGYIEREYNALGMCTTSLSYSDLSLTVRNSIVEKNARDPTKPSKVIGVHYRIELDMPGADDTASGIAGSVELMRLWKQLFFSNHYSVEGDGYPALVITYTSFLRNPHYRNSSDGPAALNMKFPAQVDEGFTHEVTVMSLGEGRYNKDEVDTMSDKFIESSLPTANSSNIEI